MLSNPQSPESDQLPEGHLPTVDAPNGNSIVTSGSDDTANADYLREEFYVWLLYERLVELRQTLAEHLGCGNPDCVFEDASLVQMTRVRPSQKRGLGRLVGIDSEMVSDFGHIFSSVIDHCCNKWGLRQDRYDAADIDRIPTPPKSSAEYTKMASLARPHFDGGWPVRPLAREFDVPENVVATLLVDYINDEGIVDPSNWVHEWEVDWIETVYSSVADAQLRSVYDALVGIVDWTSIKIIRACLRNRQAKAERK